MALVSGTPIAAFPSAGSNDATAGDTAWSNPGNITTPRKTYFTGMTTCTLAAGDETQYLVATFTPLKWLDHNGTAEAAESEGIPTGATIQGIEFVVRAAENGTTNDIDEVEARLVRASTIETGGDNKSLGRVLPNTSNVGSSNNRDVAWYTYGHESDTWGGVLPSVAQLNAGTCGIAIRYANTGVGSATVEVDSIVMRVYTTEGTFTASVRSNAVESVRMAPWGWHLHCHDSAFGSYSKADCVVKWEMIEFPDGWDPGALTDPRRGVPTEFETHYLQTLYGYNAWWICDVAGTYKARCTIYAPDNSEIATDEVTVTVSSNTRTRRYVDGGASGADDGTSAANAWTDLNDAITWLNANPEDSEVEIDGGQTYTLSSTGATLSSLDNCRIYARVGGGLVTINTTTAANSTPLTFDTNCSRLVLDGGDDGILLTTASALTDSSNGLNVQGTIVRNINIRNVQCSNRSSFCEWSASGLQVDCVGLWKCDGGQTHRYGGGFFGIGNKQFTFVGCTFTSRGTNGAEGVVRHPSDGDGFSYNWCTFGQVSTTYQGVRAGGSNVYMHQCDFDGCGNLTTGGVANRDDINTNTTFRMDGCDVDMATANFIVPGGFTCACDVVIANSVLPAHGSGNALAFGNAYRGGIRRIRAAHVVGFGASAQTVTVDGSSTSGYSERKRNRLNNSVFVRTDPQTAMTGKWFDHTYPTVSPEDTSQGLDEAGGNIFGLDNDGTTTRNNFRTERSNRTLATWNGLSYVGTDIHSRLPFGYLNENVYWGLTNYSYTGTIATGTSTTVFTLDAGASSVDDYYNGASIAVTGLGTVVVQDYVGSTRQVTAVSALFGTPSGGEAYTVSRDFTTERAQGKTALSGGAPMDYRGVFRDLTVTDTAPGLMGVETLPTMSAVTATVGDETVVLSWSAVSGATTYRVWRNYGGISAPVWYLVGETDELSYPVGGLTNDESVVLGVSVVDDLFNESEIYQKAATPLRGGTVSPMYALDGVNVNPAARLLWTNPGNMDGDQESVAATVALDSGDPISANLCGRVAPYSITGTVVAWRMDIVCQAAEGVGAYENGYWITPELYAADGTALLTGVGTVVPPDSSGATSVYLSLASGVTHQDVVDAIAAGIDNASPTLPYGISLVAFGDNTGTVTISVYNASLVAILEGGGSVVVGGLGIRARSRDRSRGA